VTPLSQPVGPLVVVVFDPDWLTEPARKRALPKNLTRARLPDQLAVTTDTSVVRSLIVRVPPPLTVVPHPATVRAVV
jgi:hypothetical protein